MIEWVTAVTNELFCKYGCVLEYDDAFNRIYYAALKAQDDYNPSYNNYKFYIHLCMTRKAKYLSTIKEEKFVPLDFDIPYTVPDKVEVLEKGKLGKIYRLLILGWTQAELAKMFGVTRQRINQLLKEPNATFEKLRNELT